MRVRRGDRFDADAQSLMDPVASRWLDTEAGRGARLLELMARLFPIFRSITGEGLRETLRIIGEHIPLAVQEVPTGTRVYDWTVPREWRIREAWIRDSQGCTVVDFRNSNLHVVSYSTPVHARLPLAVLKQHLHSLPEHPDWVPYRTSYYNDTWGFCLSHRQLEALPEGEYEVLIDSELFEGSLSYGECEIKGAREEEVVIFAHACHPSLANDNLSGIALATLLAAELGRVPLRYTYRFVFAPTTIGSITWLARNHERLDRIRHGLVCSVTGHPGSPVYKRSRHGHAEIDRVVARTLHEAGIAHEITDFSPWGYDERQFGSPGINLPVGRLTRTPNGCYPEYHTSADNLSLVSADALEEMFRLYLNVINMLEHNRSFRNLSPFGEPQLGRRGLYRTIGGQQDIGLRQNAMLWVLSFSDGRHSLLEIAERSGLPFKSLSGAALDLEHAGLLAPIDTGGPAS
jgi:aminopeptidase-like protein